MSAKAAFTCLNSEAIKVEVFNGNREDPDCNYPYPSYSHSPSYVAKSGECVRTTAQGYSRFFISSTTGKFEETDNSWDIPDYNKQVDKDAYNQTEEAIKDHAPGASSCMIADFSVYFDEKCTQENTQMDDGMK